jgi:DNA-binding winged helix-turn-helix (wHTH) protein
VIEEQSVYEFDEFRVDVRKRQLTREGEVVPLYSKAFELLLVLLQNSGQVLSKEELLERVWPDQILEEANLPVNISAIRRALGEKASQPRFIITIPGRGYRFVADLNRASDLVIERETIAQITIDEPAPLLPAPLLNEPRHDEAALAVQPGASPVAGAHANRPSLWRNRYLLAGVVITLLGAVGTTAYMVHRTRLDRIAAGRFTNVKATPITNNGRIGNVAVSPDGKFFAYTRSERGKDRGKTGIFLSQMNGEKVIELVPPGDAIVNSLEYASDGSSLCYTRQDPGGSNSALYRISALGGVPLKLRENISGEFSLSPDNSRVAFLREDPVNKTRSLVISSTDGANERTLLTSPASSLSLRAVAWSPDGSRIAIGIRADETARQLRIMLVQADNARAEALTSAVWRDITRIVWIKDGSGLLIIAAQASPEENRQVWFVSVPHGETRHVTNDASLYDRGLTVSADPNKFLVVQLKQQNNIWTGNTGDFASAKQVTFATFNLANGKFDF